MKHANEQKLCGNLFQTPYISMSFILHIRLSLMFPTETKIKGDFNCKISYFNISKILQKVQLNMLAC